MTFDLFFIFVEDRSEFVVRVFFYGSRGFFHVAFFDHVTSGMILIFIEDFFVDVLFYGRRGFLHLPPFSCD